MRELAALLVGAFSLGASPTTPSPVGFTFAVNPMIECASKTGSGVRIDDELIITARHVVEEAGPCGVDGVPATVVHMDDKLDFAVIRGDFRGQLRATVTCEGLRPGKQYLALGFPNKTPVIESLTATNKTISGKLRQMIGHIYPGMSGGGAFRMTDGAVAGLNVARDSRGYAAAFSVDLKDTYLCEDL